MTINDLNTNYTSDFQSEIDKCVARAMIAQKRRSSEFDDRPDRFVSQLSQVFSQQVRYWAEAELSLTQIGNVEDKIHKLNLVLHEVIRGIVGLKTLGRLSDDQYVVEYASPVGVIFAVSPLTNPVPNALFKTVLAVKTGNALILSFPRSVATLGVTLVSVIRDLLEANGLPADLVQGVPVPSHEKNAYIMSHPDVSLNLITGGNKLVKAAYRSGTPTIGVGAGNVPVYIDETANLIQAAKDVIRGKSYDNGIVCGSESNLLVSESVYDEFLRALDDHGAFCLSDDTVNQLGSRVFNEETSALKREYIGVDAATILKSLDVHHRPCKIIVAPIKPSTSNVTALTAEKMAPILTVQKVQPADALEAVDRLLSQGGYGHTAVIHSTHPLRIDEFAQRTLAGRLLVNTSATHGMLGETTRLQVSFMQGCGTFGGNGTTHPIGWRDFVNVKRLAYGSA